MLSLKDLILSEVKNIMQKQGLPVNIDMLADTMQIVISGKELENKIMENIPLHLRNIVKVECGDIKITVKVL